MHELGIVRSVLEMAIGEAERRAATRIKSIRLTVGELSGMDPESLSFCFEVASRGTIAEGATLVIERVGASARCDACQVTWSPMDGSFFCPSCGQGGDVEGGQDLRVEGMEVE